MFGKILDFAFLGLAIFGLSNMLFWFIKAKGSALDRLVSAGRNSLTIALTRIQLIGGSIIGVSAHAFEFLGAPGIATAIETHLDPKIVGAFAITSAVVLELARRRTLPASGGA
jgi:hypothetical protein